MRFQLVELEDLPWFPAVWRDAGTRFLRLALEKSGHAAVVAGRISGALARSGATSVVDLGSGGGGPWPVVARELPGVPVLLTDLHPNREALAEVCRASPGNLAWREEPVDATRVPPDLDGMRTMINAFHHLPPQAARAVLADAARTGRPLTILEVVSRGPLSLAAMLLSPLTFTLSLPLQRPFRWSAVLWTVIPVLPAFVLWDGVVSWLRIYQPEDLAPLLPVVEGWTWDVGYFDLGGGARGVFVEGRRAAVARG